jgi:hypothetical protein
MQIDISEDVPSEDLDVSSYTVTQEKLTQHRSFRFSISCHWCSLRK